MFKRSSFTLAMMVVLPGCSSHPLPQDYSRANTYDIVQKIRCEAKQGLTAFLDGKSADGKTDEAQKRDELIRGAAIGYLFDFTMNESDKATAGALEFENPYIGGKFGLNLSGAASKERENHRTFLVAENLEELQLATHCKGDGLAAANLLYPIAGSVGIGETVHTYLKLDHELTVNSPNDKTGLFTDVIKFTTTLNAGAVPTLQLNAAATSFKLRKATLSGAVERKDLHQVSVVLSPAKKAAETPPKKAASKSTSDLQSKSSVFTVGPNVLTTTGRILGSPTDPSAKSKVIDELRRLQSIDDQKKVFENLEIIRQ